VSPALRKKLQGVAGRGERGGKRGEGREWSGRSDTNTGGGHAEANEEVGGGMSGGMDGGMDGWMGGHAPSLWVLLAAHVEGDRVGARRVRRDRRGPAHDPWGRQPAPQLDAKAGAQQAARPLVCVAEGEGAPVNRHAVADGEVCRRVRAGRARVRRHVAAGVDALQGRRKQGEKVDGQLV